MPNTTRTTTPDTPQSITRSEFDAFSAHVDQRFNSIGHLLSELGRKIDSRTQPQYSLLVSVMALVVTIAGGAYVLFQGQIATMNSLSVARDESLEQRVSLSLRGTDRWTLDDHRAYETTVQKRFDDRRDEHDALTEKVSEIRVQLERVRAELETMQRLE